jgi:glutamate-5-semialdehyde dehydrogenase
MDASMILREMGGMAREAADILALAGTDVKNKALKAMAEALRTHQKEILEANSKDMRESEEKGLSAPMLQRLQLDSRQIENMAAGIEEIAALPDPVGQGVSSHIGPDGLEITQVRVPLGVIGVVYESRPNVTADTAALCLKSGNAVILRGGREAIRSNTAIASVLREAVASAGLPETCIQLIAMTDHESAVEFMQLDSLDVLIPRGGKGLKQAVREHCKVPYIMTGDGVCHIYIAPSADPEICVPITVNAKTQRPSACNAMETLLIHRDIAGKMLPAIATAMTAHGVELRGDNAAREIVPEMLPATEEDWSTEYLDLILSVKVVSSLDEALAHIAKYGTKHSESILTQDYAEAEKFLNSVDAAAVYVNASTRFTDGGVFGLGAEIGISTQKLHARGPMGVEQLTSTKYKIRGSGQVRR